MASTKAKVEEARERYKLVRTAEEKQRQRETEDLKFQVPELQWSDKDKSARAGGDGTPPRPTLSISKLDQPRMLILNQMRSADLGVQVHPVSEDAEQETAEAIQGLYRHIERKSRAELARYWAFDRAVTAGRGAYRVLTEYDDEGGDPSDQRIVIKRILHQEGVYFDPAATEPDYSDGRFVFVVAWISKDEFARRYPNAQKKGQSKLNWEGLREEAPEWVRDDDVLVAEYWYKEPVEEEFEVEDGTRTRASDAVYRCMLSGWEELEPSQLWPGKLIPIVPTVGRELQPFDEERRFVGMIRPARDGQQLYNYAASTLVERMALEPKAPFVAGARSIEGYEDLWKQANARNFAVLPYNDVVEGQVVPPPQRAQVDSAGMSIAMMALQEADQFIQAATATFDPSLGRLPQKERSGRAILALQQQGDAGTSHFLQNLADISMNYEARVVLDLMPIIYDRPGRITQIIRGDDGKSEPVMLNAPFMVDHQTKRPMPAKPGQPGVKNYDLKRGVYSVSVSVGKNFQTRLEHGAEFLTELVSKMPALMPMIGDLVFQFRDDPGAREIAKRFAKIREKQFPGLGEGEDGQPTPEQMQGQLEQMGQALKQMEGQFKGVVQALETEQAKQQATMMKAQLEAQTASQKAELEMARAQLEADTKLRISGADNETKLAIAGLQAQMDEMLEVLKLTAEAAKLRKAQEHEAVMGELGRPAPEEPEPAEVPE